MKLALLIKPKAMKMDLAVVLKSSVKIAQEVLVQLKGQPKFTLSNSFCFFWINPSFD